MLVAPVVGTAPAAAAGPGNFAGVQGPAGRAAPLPQPSRLCDLPAGHSGNYSAPARARLAHLLMGALRRQGLNLRDEHGVHAPQVSVT